MPSLAQCLQYPRVVGLNVRLSAAGRTVMLKIAAAALVALFALSACGGESFSTPLFEETDAQVQQGDAAPDSDQPEASPETQPDAATAETSETGPEPDAQPETDAAPEAAEEDAAPEASPEAGPEACVPGTCETLGKNCGPTPDGCGNTLTCGTCPSNQLCGGGGEENVCGGCVPDTCEAHGYKCGAMDDGCGNTLTCGPAPVNKGANSNCEAMGLSDLWQCGGAAVQPEFAPPTAGCKPFAYYYCCPG